MDLSAFETLLKQTIGLEAESIGSSSIANAVQQQMSKSGIKTRAEYLARLESSPAELQALVEAVVVPETWFFRHRESFDALAKIVREEWLPAHSAETLRLLSVPCCTGEEPYSMAMTLLGAGVTKVAIDAVDVSTRVLSQAARGVYGKNAFRGKHVDFKETHFRPVTDGHELNDTVRRLVRFEQGNVLDEQFRSGRERYQIIFCRNLLIYFDRPTQDRVIQALDRLLAENGLLFVGPSETPLMLHHGFVSARLPLSFAFRKEKVVPRKPHPVVAPQPAPRRQVVTVRKREKATPLKATRIPETKNQPAPCNPEINLECAKRLANEGELDRAAEICERHVRQLGASAQAFYLLGLVRDARADDDRARECYRKAIYLEPNHHEALLHLAFLTERHGDAKAAQVLHSRAARAKERV